MLALSRKMEATKQHAHCVLVFAFLLVFVLLKFQPQFSHIKCASFTL